MGGVCALDVLLASWDRRLVLVRPISRATSLHATCLTMLRIYNQPTTPSSSSCVPVAFLLRNALHKRFRSLPEATHANSPAIGPRGRAGALRTVPGYHPPA